MGNPAAQHFDPNQNGHDQQREQRQQGQSFSRGPERRSLNHRNILRYTQQQLESDWVVNAEELAGFAGIELGRGHADKAQNAAYAQVGQVVALTGGIELGRKRLNTGLQEEIDAARTGDGGKQTALDRDQLRIVVALKDGIRAGGLGPNGAGAGQGAKDGVGKNRRIAAHQRGIADGLDALAETDGAGVAVDAAARGLSVALVDAGDIATAPAILTRWPKCEPGEKRSSEPIGVAAMANGSPTAGSRTWMFSGPASCI